MKDALRRSMSTAKSYGAGAPQWLQSAGAVCLLLDYDGALVEHTPQPELASPDNELLALLMALASHPSLQVHVISGRARRELESWLGHLPVSLHAEHGLYFRGPGGQNWEDFPIETGQIPSKALEVLLSACDAVPGSFFERKERTIAWHYRTAPEQRLRRTLLAAETCMRKELEGSGFELRFGARVLEIVPRHLNKSIITRFVLKRSGEAVPAAFGCETVDEEVFEVVNEHGISVRVGYGPTCARYRLRSVQEVRAALLSLVQPCPELGLGSVRPTPAAR